MIGQFSRKIRCDACKEIHVRNRNRAYLKNPKPYEKEVAMVYKRVYCERCEIILAYVPSQSSADLCDWCVDQISRINQSWG